MLQKEESNYDETSIMCSKRIAFIGFAFHIYLQTLLQVWRANFKGVLQDAYFKKKKKKKLNLWLCLSYSNERLAL